MKKFLSLVLALVMTMSLVTVSAGAKDFTDSDELSGVVYEEAVNVMSEMGIIDGYSDGDFRPQGTLTRGAAAKIIACMMLGKTTAEALGTQAAPFKDVPAGSTFAGYIAYCVEAGLIDGYADGTFRPSGTLTGFAFLKMLLTSLGYDSSIEGYTGTNWTVNVASRATQIGLTDGNDEFVGTQPATREEACLYAVNTLKATLVEYENKGQEIVVSDGTVITVRPSAPTYVTSSIAGAATSIDDTWDNTTHDYTVEFAEKYQPDLELNGTTDAFGRPSHIWTWKNDEIGTYVNYDELIQEYTAKVTGEDLYNLLGRAALDECKDAIYTYVDGETDEDVLKSAYFTKNQMAKNYDSTVGETGNGVLTQVFHDTRDDEITVAVINTYLAKAVEDYDEKNDELDLTVYAVNDVTNRDNYVKDTSEDEDMTVSGEDFDIDEVTEGDLFLVTIADGEIQTMEAPEVLAGSTVTSFRVDKYVVSGGTQYDFSSTARYDVDTLYNWTGISAESNLKDLTYDIILDPYGYAIGVKLVEDPDQYVFLTGLDERFSNLGARNADANVIFTDGRMETVTVNLRNSRGLIDSGANIGRPDDKNTLLNGYDEWEYGQLNTWCTYTVDSNGVYTLRRVPTVDEDTAGKTYKAMQEAQDAAGADVEINKSHVALDGVGGGVANNAYSRVYGNDETIYINVDKVTDLTEIKDSNTDPRTIIDDVDSVTVGVRNVDVVVEDLAASSWSNIFDDEIYTLHDDDGYIIAVITVGEDQGSTTNYAYITDNVRQETYGSDEDEWSWLLPAIVNGKAVDLREVGDALTELNGRTVGAWYEVRYDADGNVRRVNPITFVGIYNPLTNTKYLNNIDAVQDAIDDGTDDLLLSQNFRSTGQPYTDVVDLSFKGNTLFINTLGSATRGFSVSPDVNVVLCLADRNHNPFDDVDDSYTGAAGLQKALRNLDTTPTDSDGDGIEEYTLDGILSFVMEDGVITSIVLNDYTGPRANRFDAATPTVTIAASKAPVYAGDNLVLTANVAAGNYGELTYQWYLSTNGGASFSKISGADKATYTVGTVADSMAGNQYKCVVTNTDERSSITGDTVVSDEDVYTLAIAAGSMTIQVNYYLTDGTTFIDDNAPATFEDLDDGIEDGYVTLNSTSLAGKVPGDYEIARDVYVPFEANTKVTVNVTVEHKMVDVEVPAGKKLSWSADTSQGVEAGSLTADGKAPAGVTATVTLESGVGSYDEEGNAYSSESIVVGKDTISETDYGYYKITFTIGSDDVVFGKVGSELTIIPNTGSDWANTGWETAVQITGFGADVIATDTMSVTFEITSITGDVSSASLSWV